MMMSVAQYVPKPSLKSSWRYTMTTNTYVESASLLRKVSSLLSTCVSLFPGLLSHLLPPFFPFFFPCPFLSYPFPLPIEQILGVPFKSVVNRVIRDIPPDLSFYVAAITIYCTPVSHYPHRPNFVHDQLVRCPPVRV